MPSALRRSRKSGNLPRAIRTLIGRGNSRPSLRATPPCDTSLPAGATPSGRVRSFLAKASYTADDGTVLLVRQPTDLPAPYSQRPVGRASCLLNDEPSRAYVALLMRPWVMPACHSTASCHLGTTRNLRILERFYWLTGMSICTRWWLRHCVKC